MTAIERNQFSAFERDGLQISLSFGGKVFAHTSRGLKLPLAEVLRIISGTASRADYTSRFRMLEAIDKQLDPLCDEYKRGMVYTVIPQCIREEVEDHWHEARQACKSTVEGLNRRKQLHHIERQLHSIRSRTSEGIFVEEDRARVVQLQGNIDPQQSSLMSIVRTLQQDFRDYDRGVELISTLGFNPYEKCEPNFERENAFRAQLKQAYDTDCTELLQKLALAILQVRAIFQQVTTHERVRCITAFEVSIERLEDLFVYATGRELFRRVGVLLPGYGMKGLPPDIPYNLERTADELISLCYFGIIHEANRYLHQLPKEDGYISALKRKAVSNAIFTAKGYFEHNSGVRYGSRYQNQAGITLHWIRHDHQALLQAINAHNKKLSKDYLEIVVGANRIVVHRSILLRLGTLTPNYFQSLLSGNWGDSLTKTITLPDTFIWEAVVDFVGWLYGLHELQKTPAVYRNHLTAVCEFIVGRIELPNKF